MRAVRRRELFRVAVADLLGELDPAQVGYALTDITAATLEAALAVSVKAIEAERRTDLPTRLAIVAMGRFGGFELSFGSDADVMFVHDPVDGAGEDASRAAHDVANELRRLLALPGTDPALEVDTGLRPEGKQGPLVRSLDSYAAYYAKWSAVWEAQALLRAEAIVGDRDLRARYDRERHPEAARRSPREARTSAPRYTACEALLRAGGDVKRRPPRPALARQRRRAPERSRAAAGQRPFGELVRFHIQWHSP